MQILSYKAHSALSSGGKKSSQKLSSKAWKKSWRALCEVFFIPIYIFKNSSALSCWIILVSPRWILILSDLGTWARLWCLTHKTDSLASFCSFAHLARLSDHPDKWDMTAGLPPLLCYRRSEQLHMDICAHAAYNQIAERDSLFSTNASIANAHEIMKSSPGCLALSSQRLTRWRSCCCANCFWIQLHSKFKAAEKVQLSK